MKLIDALLGRPTLPRMMADTGAWLRQRGISAFDIEPVLMQLSLQLPDGSQHRIQLGRLWPHWQQAPRRARARLLHDYLHEMLTAGE